MKGKNLDITVPAVLYIKSKLLLNGFGDLSIKDMLRQIGLDVDKPFKISFENEYWLKYECEGKTISFHFDNDTLKSDSKKILVLDIVNEGIWERFGFFKPEIGKTRLSKISFEQKGSLFLKDNKEINDASLIMSNDDIEEFNIDEIIRRGITGPFEIVLRINSSILRPSKSLNGIYINCLRFDISNWGDDMYYKFDSNSNKKLIEFLKKLNHRDNINIIDIYEEICSIYGLHVENMKRNYRVNLYISMKNANCNLSKSYNIEEENGTIEVREDGLVSTYTRKTERGLSLIRRKGKNARNEV